MDSTGTFQMALECQKHKIITCIHKHYNIDDWLDFINNSNNTVDYDYICVSTGISEDDFNKTLNILNLCPYLKMICIDVANGYSERFVETIQKFRSAFSDKIIIAGNVVTSEMTEQLILG